jgi:hypothetical protein
MEGVDLLRIYVDYENGESKNCKGDFSDKIEQELLKRLSQNNIEEFKNRLIDEIYKLPTSFSDNGYDAVELEEVEKIINNIK